MVGQQSNDINIHISRPSHHLGHVFVRLLSFAGLAGLPGLCGILEGVHSMRHLDFCPRLPHPALFPPRVQAIVHGSLAFIFAPGL